MIQKLFIFLFAVTFLSLGQALPLADGHRVQTVPYVNLGMFLGSWHEIASIPQYFQRNCVKNTVANYSLDSEPGRVVVMNTCDDSSNHKIYARGQAKVYDAQTNAKLSVTFLNLGAWIYLVSGNFWILDLGPDYRYTVVGDGDGTYGWIMSRSPRISEEDLVSAMTTLKRNGYNLCRFFLTPQTGGTAQKLNLCDIAPSLRARVDQNNP